MNKTGSTIFFLFVMCALVFFSATASAQEGGVIELDVSEIESEVPRRVAQFFVQRDRLHYQPIDSQPSFMPQLLKSVEEEPF